MDPERAGLRLRDEIGLPRAAGAVWVRRVGEHTLLVVRLAPGFHGFADRIPAHFDGFATQVIADVENRGG